MSERDLRDQALESMYELGRKHQAEIDAMIARNAKANELAREIEERAAKRIAERAA